MKVSAIVVCYNRETEIGPCLRSLRFADEVVAVDSFSTDGTAEIARRFANACYQHPYTFPGNQKNWAIDRTSHPWIVAIDSDEIIPGELQDEILRELQCPRFDNYRVYRRNYLFGREMKHAAWKTDTVAILFRKDRYRFLADAPHSDVVPRGSHGFLKARLIHHPHQSIDEFVAKSSSYAAGTARKYFREGRRGTALKMFLHPGFNFLKNYILRGGFRDGAPGLISAVLSTGYVAEKYARLWELGQTEGKGWNGPGSDRRPDTGGNTDEPRRDPDDRAWPR
ncbi:MAG: glycosyltransferase family 2 protein [PVC group bacterium]